MNMQAHIMDRTSPQSARLSEVPESDTDGVPLHKQQIIVPFSAEPFVYTEGTAALIAEQITSMRSQLEDFPQA